MVICNFRNGQCSKPRTFSIYLRNGYTLERCTEHLILWADVATVRIDRQPKPHEAHAMIERALDPENIPVYSQFRKQKVLALLQNANPTGPEEGPLVDLHKAYADLLEVSIAVQHGLTNGWFGDPYYNDDGDPVEGYMNMGTRNVEKHFDEKIAVLRKLLGS